MTIPILGMGNLAAHSPALGNKVKNLAILARAGMRVPRGFGLPYDVYEEHVANLLPKFDKARERCEDYKEMASQLQRLVISTPFSGAKEVIDALGVHMPGARFFAVRSSGAPVVSGREIVEDSAEASLAGQYESYLLVPAHNVPQAVLWCYASLFNERCLRQFKVKEDGGYLWSRMSVLIQEMCIADLSAVVMTRDPVEGGDCFGIEITYGACESLVSGEVQGDLYLLSRTTGKLLSTELGTKTTRISYEALESFDTDNKIKSRLSTEQSMRYAAPRDVISQIYRLGMHIEQHFGTPQDIELVVSDDDIVVTQTRPITGAK